MPKKTKKEYETVEKEIEYTECDVPGCFHTDEDKELIELVVNPRYKVEHKHEPTVIQECDGFSEAENWVRQEKRKITKSRMGYDPTSTDTSYAAGYSSHSQIKQAKSDASFFVCQHCLKNHFEAVPEHYDPDKTTEIKTGNNRILIRQPINPTFSIPDWIIIFTWFVVITLSSYLLYLNIF